MAFDLVASAIILVAACTIGRGILAALHVDHIREGDRFILSAWLGVIVLAVALLTVSLAGPVSPRSASAVTVPLVALGALAGLRARGARAARVQSRATPTRAAVTGGVALILLGSAALASDPVTLYDSLVYHIGLIEWLRQHGTVPGIALIHTRLGHVSAWFTLAAPFDTGALAHRSANVSLGVALVLVGLQIAIPVSRIASRRARVSDWFLAFTSIVLVWAVATRGAATPSPDASTNVLIVVAAWSLLVVAPLISGAGPAPARSESQTGSHRSLANPAFLPFVVALGACAMKLFALPAAVATGLYAIATRPGDDEQPEYVRRAVACLILAGLIVGPFVAANVVASGCPAFPSPIGCVDAPWSVGAVHAADYSGYVRDVARWERRGETSVGASLGWIAPWILAHPLIAAAAIVSPFLAWWLWTRSVSRPGSQPVVEPRTFAALATLALLGIAFAGWFAPAPRFLYAFVAVIPAWALGAWLQPRLTALPAGAAAGNARRSRAAFVAASAVVGFTYALASQKLNVWSAVANGAPFLPVTASDLVVPRAPETPARLFHWRVNDVDVMTPVPRPVADTLGYHSVIPVDASFEKCSTATLPCTPYLPDVDVTLRHPAIGLSGGFIRAERPDLAGRIASCLGELSAAEASAQPLKPADAADASRCGAEPR
jgi:hypothetical protein